jgi:serine/threonine protein kinase
MSSTPPSPADAPAPNALTVGSRLAEYEILAVIGIGGFGIVYRALDHALEREVAIKEYLPMSLAGRSATRHVSLLSQGYADTFALGLRSFVNEAKLLAKFDHPSLVKVHRFWEEHSTAYMVMPLYVGRTLREVRQAMDHSPDEAWIRALLDPLLGALDVLHKVEVYHRDIAPDNILIAPDGQPVLLDFGAARRVITDRSQNLTAILKPRYAPIEQYAESSALRQGAWTDLYALGATLHFLVVGEPPAPSTTRIADDDQPALADTPRAGISTPMLQLIDWMLAPRPQHRPQSVAQVRAVLDGRSVIPPRGTTVFPPPAPASGAAAGWQDTQVLATGVDQDSTVIVPRPGSGGPVPTGSNAATEIVPRSGMNGGRVGGPPDASTTPAIGPAGRSGAARKPWWLVAVAVVVVGVAYALLRKPSAEPPAIPAVTAVEAPAALPIASASAAPSPEASAVALAARSGSDAASSASIAVAPPSAAASMARTVVVRKPVPPPPLPQRASGAQIPAEVSTPPRSVASPATQPDPVPAPAPAVAAPADPNEICGKRMLVAYHRCMLRECERPMYSGHPECRRIRAIDERRPGNFTQ